MISVYQNTLDDLTGFCVTSSFEINSVICMLQQAWSSRGQQLLVPAAWQQMTPVGPPPCHPPPPPPSSLNDTNTSIPQMISDWG